MLVDSSKYHLNQFRWDLFLIDYRAYMIDVKRNPLKTFDQVSADWNVSDVTLYFLRVGKIDRVRKDVLMKIIKGMGLYYEFYCELKDTGHE